MSTPHQDTHSLITNCLTQIVPPTLIDSPPVEYAVQTIIDALTTNGDMIVDHNNKLDTVILNVDQMDAPEFQKLILHMSKICRTIFDNAEDLAYLQAAHSLELAAKHITHRQEN